MKTVSKLKSDLDKIFSKYIRLRDSNPDNGFGKCCTCNRILHWKEGDAGHFQPRQHNATRYHEQNVNLQCKKCNNKNWNQGEQYLHGKYIDRKHGAGTADSLERLARCIKQFKPYELEDLISTYKQKLKYLEV
jgi:5-methylcytosine-specific restriction endonuclease McrA